MHQACYKYVLNPIRCQQQHDIEKVCWRRSVREGLSEKEGSSEKVYRRRSDGEDPTEKIRRRRFDEKGLTEKVRGRRSEGEGPMEKVHRKRSAREVAPTRWVVGIENTEKP